MNLTLVVLAAGRGSRYRGLKQVDAIGPSDEALMDYSLYDAIKAGFGKVVFVIRRDIEELFKTHTGHGIGRSIPTEYVFQELSAVPEGFSVPPERVKPWGTAHAVLASMNAVKGPFAVINADDYYGRESYQVLADFLKQTDSRSSSCCMVSFALNNTLSEHGPVSRAVCGVDSNGNLKTIVERTRIEKKEGRIRVALEDGTSDVLSGTERVSMNMWGFTPLVLDRFGSEFEAFMRVSGNDPGSEFYIPSAIGSLIRTGKASVKVLNTEAKWFGITYPDDKAAVAANIRKLVNDGKYPDNVRF